MKLFPACLLLLIANALPALAANVEAGPNGGRLLTNLEPRAEFYLTADRHIQITFVDPNGEPVAPGPQIVKVTTGQRSAPTTLTFSEANGVLRSDAPVPAGNHFPTVVQIKPTTGAGTIVNRFYLNMIVCSGCDHPEYACTCGH